MVDETSQTAQNARSSRQARARARPRDLTERLNVFARAAALGVLIALLGIGMFGRFYTARFNGLVSTTAMEIGDIAQQLRSGRGMSTRVIRPLALAYGQPDEEGVMPETLHAPLYPLLLSWLFRARGGGDASVAIFNGLMFLLTGWVIFAIARGLWDKVIALLAVAVYFVNVDAIGQALTGVGASLAGLLFTVAIWAALRNRQSIQSSSELSEATVGHSRVIWPLMVGGIFGLTYLAGLTSLLLFIPLAVLATASSRLRWQQVGLIAITAVVVISPWLVRNLRVSGTLLPPMANYVLLTHTQSYPGESIFQQMPGQVLSPVVFAVAHPAEMLRKIGHGLTRLYRGGPAMLNPYLFPFFILGAFLFDRTGLKRSLWRVVIAMFLVQALSICLYGQELHGLGVILPAAICLAVGGLVEALRRTETTRLTQILVASVIVALVLFPTLSSAVLGGKFPGNPSLGSFGMLRAGLTEDAVIATDSPAPVAWYAYKSAVLLPSSPQALEDMQARGVNPDYIYFSHGMGKPGERRGFDAWHELLQSQEQRRHLGQLFSLSQGELLFERINKRVATQDSE